MIAQELPESASSEATSKFVTAKLLDFDWLFMDGNAKKLLQMLVNTENEKLFETKSISIFI